MKTAILKIIHSSYKLLKNLAKSGIEPKENKSGKIILAISVMAILGIIGLLYFIQTVFLQVVCMGILGKVNPNCPDPIFDPDDTNEIASQMYLKRKGLTNKFDEDAQMFDRWPKNVDEMEEDEKMKQSRYYLLVLEQLDAEVISLHGLTNKSFMEGEELEYTNYGIATQYAKKEMGKTFSLNKFFSSTEKKFGEARMDVWRCYLLGKKCDEDHVESVLEKESKPITNLIGSKTTEELEDEDGEVYLEHTADYKRLRSMFEEYYPYSLYEGLENGEEIFYSRLDEILELLEFDKIAPDQVSGMFSAMGGMGYTPPLDDGVYLFTSDFSSSRELNGEVSPHNGVDLATNSKVPMYAANSGEVIGVGFSPSYGGFVTIEHDEGEYTTYNHMKSENIVVEEGDEVMKGQFIAGVGNEGHSYGSHLHFETCPKTRTITSTVPSSGLHCDNHVNPKEDPFELDMKGNTITEGAKMIELAEEFDQMMEDAKNGEVIIKEGVENSMLGWLTATCETGACAEGGIDFGRCTISSGDPGGLSCGAYQFAAGRPGNSAGGSLQGFFKHLKKHHPDHHKSIGDYDPHYDIDPITKNWRATHDEYENKFEMAQQEFAYEEYFQPYVQGLKKQTGGFDVTDANFYVQEMFFSMYIQHGGCVHINGSGCTAGVPGSILSVAGYDKLTNKEVEKDPEKFVKNVYEARTSKYGGHNAGVKTRFEKEEAYILDNL